MLFDVCVLVDVLLCYVFVMGGEMFMWVFVVCLVVFVLVCCVINYYGLIEVMVGVFVCDMVLIVVDVCDFVSGVLFGLLLLNVCVLVFDVFGVCVLVGVMGELYLGGLGVVCGYFGWLV